MQVNITREVHAHYNEDYYTGKSEYSYRDERGQEKFDRYVHNARLQTIARFHKPPANLLDIGCAFGGFIKSANDIGYKAQGLDVSPYAANEGCKEGLNIKAGILEPHTFLANSFDVITLIEVIEHITNPQEYLKQIQNILKPGGLLVIQTANYNGWQATQEGSSYHYYLPGHYYYYSLENLKLLLSQHGFKKFKSFIPVDFGLLPKLKKSRGSFKTISDYLNWVRISLYHFKGKIFWKNKPWTSSMVLYAFIDK